MLAMIDRFLFLQIAVSKALVVLSIETNLTEDDFVLLEQVQFALEPLKLGVEALCLQDSTLLSADPILRFLFVQLETCQSKFSIQLATPVKKQVIERQKGDLASLLCFLHDLKCLKEQDKLFPMPSKVMQKKPKELLHLLFPNQSDQDDVK